MLAVPIRVAACAVLVAQTLGAQTTVVVSGGGSAFNDAVQRATPGDHLVVRAGRYDALLVDRGLLVDCDPGVEFVAGPLQGTPSRIAGIPATERLVLRGGSNLGGSGAVVEITGCAGAVSWSLASFEPTPTYGRISIEQCGAVLLDAPQFPGADPIRGSGWRIEVSGSSVVVSDAAACAPVTATASQLALNAVSITRTYNTGSLNATRSGVSIRGGQVPGSVFNLGVYSLPGIALTASELTVTGGAVVTSGNGQVGMQGAIEGDAGCVVRLDPGVQLTAPGAPVQGVTRVLTETLPFVRLPGRIGSGTPFVVTTHGAAQDVVFVLLDLPGPAIGTPFGPLWVRATSPLFDVVPIPAGATSAQTSFVTPPLPAAVQLVLQPIRVGRAGDVTLGPPSPVLVN